MGDVKTSGESHYLSVDYAPGEAIDLTPYAGNELKISYDIRINTTENHPDPKAIGWLNTIRNGKIQLFAVPAGEADANKNGFPVGGDGQGMVHCKQGELTDIEANTWLTVTMPVPQAILDAGKITKFHMYIYNDMNNFNPAWSKDAGVTMSLRNVQISKIGGTVVTPADKTALNAAIAAAKAKVEADYTVESWAVMAAKLTAAEATAAKADATQAEVDTATNELNAAIAALVVKPTPVIVYGDLTHDGQVKAEDALKALQAVTSKITLTAEEEIAADVDNVKGVSAADALMILQHATGKISRFPVENTTPDPKPQTDKTALNAAVNAAKAVGNLDAYTDETVSAFTEALTKAEAVAAKEDATQDEIDAAKAALEAAQAGLTAKPISPKPDDPDDGDGLGSGDGADDTLKG